MPRPPDRGPTARSPLLRPTRPAHGAERLRAYGVHPGGLPADVWQGLGAALPPDVGLAVFDLQTMPEYFEAALTGAQPAISLAEMARRCMLELTASHPPGLPFTLVGWSFGGVVAFELTRRMYAGAAPLGLAVLDSIAPTPDFKRTDELLEPPLLVRWFAMYLAAKRGRPLTAEPGVGGETAEDGLAEVLATATATGVLPADTTMPGLRKLYDSFVAGLVRNNRLVLPYEPGWSDRPLTLVKPVRGLLPDHGLLGWDELAPVRAVASPGDHYSMLFDPSAWALVADLISRPAVSTAA
ncbi:MAG TPA: thioesterase domain-containing protein [Mycobacteriales bacterium]|nr:thioesterase domain-containing protein [Mycobacteriales bacterium]